MRILTTGPSGVVAMQRVLDWLVAHGEQVWMVDYRNHYRTPPPASCHFQSFLPVPKAAGVELILKRVGLGAAAQQVKIARLQRLARAVQPDLVHVHSMDVRGTTCVDAGLSPMIVSAWGGLTPLLAAAGQRLSPVAHKLVAACDLLLVDTPALLEPVRPLLKPGARVEFMPFGADTQHFQPGRTAQALEWRTFFAIPDDAFVLLSPRMWAEFYNHQDILRAYALAFPQFTRPTYLALVGLGTGPDALPHMTAAWQAVAHTAAAATVRWLPRIKYYQMPVLYGMSDAVINYPSHDAFAVTLIETAASELPLVTPLLPAYRGTFVEKSATLVQPRSLEALAAALVQVVNEPADARRPRLQTARQIVQSMYDDVVVQQALWQHYQDIAAA